MKTLQFEKTVDPEQYYPNGNMTSKIVTLRLPAPSLTLQRWSQNPVAATLRHREHPAMASTTTTQPNGISSPSCPAETHTQRPNTTYTHLPIRPLIQPLLPTLHPLRRLRPLIKPRAPLTRRLVIRLLGRMIVP